MSSAPLPAAAPPVPVPAIGRGRHALILTALTLGGFAIGTSEFAGMGLMPNMVAELGVSEPQVGHLISAYALGVVVGAPLLAILGGTLSRKALLLALMSFYAAGNLASALGPDYHSLLLFRFIAGLPHGAYFGVAALTAVSISPPHQRGRAVSLVMLGLTLAILVGTPLATWMGQMVSWRWAFAAVSVISLVTVALTALCLPRMVDGPRERALDELRAFNRLPVWQALLIGAIGFAGMFCVFSYLAPTMVQVTGVAPAWIPLGLAGFGLGGVIGNMVGGWLFDRLKFRAVPVVLAWATVMLLLFPLAAHAPWSLLLATVCIGSMGALGPILQSHLMDVADGAQTLAAASHHAAFNAANALGPWLGGMAISAGLGWTSTGVVGAATAVAGIGLYLWAARTRARRRQVCPVAP
ncbi:DHA1 family inner membrane transport protein [Pseudoxanthomonas broegbernensis]|uniref:MFS transporter n=1 Tax=Pseudoxanthomonas broegbernensis TaxID=83619 RepID=UPI0016197FE3|nr:MFS transporter [Pseudoxanthomonas broegbernensis]MBB6063490.1 DHA1 family inner membrane transport protein [Pseudoxanthomonas broegbernensis]